MALPTNHPRAEEVTPRFKATGLRLVAASSCEADLDGAVSRLVHVHLATPSALHPLIGVSVLMPAADTFDWDLFVDVLLEPGSLPPGVQSGVIESLRKAGHRYHVKDGGLRGVARLSLFSVDIEPSLAGIPPEPVPAVEEDDEAFW